MEEKNAILGIATLKSMEALTAVYRHNYRAKEVPNADPARRHLNKELIAGGDVPYADVVSHRIATSPYYQARNVRQNAVLLVEVLLTHSPLPGGVEIPRTQWEQANLRWLEERFGEKNVISAVCHYDERTPHIHAVIIPMLEDGRLGSSRMLGGREGFKRMHDSYAAAMAQFGFVRGVEGSTAKHVRIKKFYGMLREALGAVLPEPEPLESKEEYWMRANETYQACHAQLLHLQQRCATLEGQNKGLERQRDRAIRELETEKERFSQFLNAKSKIITYFETFLAGLKRGILPREKVQKLREIIDQVVKRERECREEDRAREEEALLEEDKAR